MIFHCFPMMADLIEINPVPITSVTLASTSAILHPLAITSAKW